MKYFVYVYFCAAILVAVSGCRKFEYNNPVDAQSSLHPPENLHVVALAETLAHIAWSDPNVYADQQRSGVTFEIEERRDDSAFTLVKKISIDSSHAFISGQFFTNHIYSFRIRIIANDNKTVYSNIASTHIVFSSPIQLSLSSLADSAVKLQWQDTNSFTQRYEIERSTDGTTFSLLAVVSKETTSVVLHDAYRTATIYYFRIRSISHLNNSVYTPPISFAPVFAPPFQVSVNGGTDSVVTLLWSDTSSYTTQYEIERSTNGSSYTLIKTVERGTTAVTLFDSYNIAVPYYFRVKGKSRANVSPYSISVSYTCNLFSPSALAMNFLTSNAIVLQWKDNSTFESGFTIERQTSNGSFVHIGTVAPNTTQFTDNTLSTQENYHYRVRAFTLRNASNYSSPLAISYAMKSIALHKILTGHISSVNSIAFSPDGQTLASASGDKTIKLWNVIGGELLRTFSGHTNQIYAVAFSPDGQTLASASVDKTIKLWQTNDATLLRTFSGHTNAVNAVAFSPNGQTLASGSFDKNIILWKVSDASILQTLSGHTNSVNAVSFSPDGTLLSSGGGDNLVKIWRASDGVFLRNIAGHSNNISTTLFHPVSTSDQILATGSLDNTIKLWHATDGTLLRTLTSDSCITNTVAFSSDGKILVSGNVQENINVWHDDGTIITSIHAHSDVVNSVAFSSDGKFIASGSSDRTVKLWNIVYEWVSVP